LRFPAIAGRYSIVTRDSHPPSAIVDSDRHRRAELLEFQSPKRARTLQHQVDMWNSTPKPGRVAKITEPMNAVEIAEIELEAVTGGCACGVPAPSLGEAPTQPQRPSARR
jgi:hypothetical protein